MGSCISNVILVINKFTSSQRKLNYNVVTFFGKKEKLSNLQYLVQQLRHQLNCSPGQAWMGAIIDKTKKAEGSGSV